MNDRDIKVIYEDEDLFVINKPAGIIVNKSDTTKGEITVQDWVDETFSVSGSKETDFYKRGGIVHRIDKETSGVLLIARTEEAFLNLQTQFKERKVEKTYLALAHGRVEPETGEINVPVGRLPWNRKRFGVLSGGRESNTQYKVLEIKDYVSGKSREPVSLLELHPKTGRTHQIRVHLKHINRPIFSDPLYAGRKISRDDRKVLGRIFLHALRISFFHPRTNKSISFDAPLPKELNDFLGSLALKT